MQGDKDGIFLKLLRPFITYIWKIVFSVLSVGPIPNHIALIMDGNRRYAKKRRLEEQLGHNAGFTKPMSLLPYFCDFGVKYITVYAFSIDNFNREPEGVQRLMDLMVEKINGLLKEDSVVFKYGVRVYFLGNLKLLHESVRVAAEKLMLATAKNTKMMLMVCLAYTSTDEITHSAQESVRELATQGIISDQGEDKGVVKLVDLEKNMYAAVAPDPDILIRSSGETRLSNFLLWQSTDSLLYSPKALWPEIGAWHVLWAILNFQKHHSYLQKNIKQS